MTNNMYNMLGEAIYTKNIDSGRRWAITDIAGKPIYRWDNRHHQSRNTYDTLQRPVNLFIKENTTETQVEKTEYGTVSNTNTNRNGKLFRQYDQSGFNTIFKYDFKGNPVYLRKRFCEVYNQTIDWNGSPTLLSYVFNTEMTYDAMDRLTELTQPDDSVIAYGYNKAGLLETVKAKLRGATSYIDFVTNINYNEKGQRTEIYYKNGSKTAYTYDGQSTHTVVKGDTLWDIAQKSNGKYSVQDLLDWNPVIDPKQLQIGAEINLSDKNLLTYQWNEPSITSLGDLSPAYETYDSPESKNSYVGSNGGGGWKDGVSVSLSSDVAYPIDGMGYGGTIGLFFGSKDATLFFTAKKGEGVMLNGYSGDVTYYRNLRGEALLSRDIFDRGGSLDIGLGVHGTAFSYASDPQGVLPFKYAAGTYSLSGMYSLQVGGAVYDTYTVPLSFGSGSIWTDIVFNTLMIQHAFNMLK